MYNAIKITTNNEIERVFISFEDGNERDVIKNHIGNDCEYYVSATPVLLQNLFNTSSFSPKRTGIIMLVDDNGFYKNLDINTISTILYQSDENISNYIVGNVLIVGTIYDYASMGYNYCSLPLDMLNHTYNFLSELKIYMNLGE